MTGPTPRRSPLAVIVLLLLAEEPMHPYRMGQLIRERGKDGVVNVAQRNSVYQTIDRLLRDGLIRVHETEREERRPERTVYAITPAGTGTLADWVRAMLRAPAREFPEFPAALTALPALSPDEAARLLTERLAAIEARLDAIRDGAAKAREAGLPRLFLIEDEYVADLLRAERRWLVRLIADLRSGELRWDRAWLHRFAGRELSGWPPLD